MHIIKLLIAVLLLQSAPLVAAELHESKTVILVRHAEKDSQRPDPGLTAIGQQRAIALMSTLERTPLSLAITTQFRRTQETLAPLIAARNLNHVSVTASKNIDEHIQEISQLVSGAKGNVIIAGHSNTVPLIIAALGGPILANLSEDEYDKLFILTLPYEGALSIVTTQYGLSSGNE